MSFIKTVLNKIFKEKDNRPIVLINEKSVKINNDMGEIFSPKEEAQREMISTTMAFHFLLQATADLADERENALELGLIDETMTHLQSLACLYARYVFMGYEKKHSPLIVASLIKNYCVENLFEYFSTYYVALANSEGFDFNLTCFDSDSIDSFMDIKGSANRMQSLGYKKHWIPPFKTPYKEEWATSF